jgi:hypothetical protein
MAELGVMVWRRSHFIGRAVETASRRGFVDRNRWGRGRGVDRCSAPMWRAAYKARARRSSHFNDVLRLVNLDPARRWTLATASGVAANVGRSLRVRHHIDRGR